MPTIVFSVCEALGPVVRLAPAAPDTADAADFSDGDAAPPGDEGLGWRRPQKKQLRAVAGMDLEQPTQVLFKPPPRDTGGRWCWIIEHIRERPQPAASRSGRRRPSVYILVGAAGIAARERCAP
jgi:hypothetical protein